MSWDRDLKQFIRDNRASTNEILQETIRRVGRDLNRFTPIDEGDLISDWTVIVRNRELTTQSPPIKQRTTARRRLDEASKQVKWDDIVIFLNEDSAAVPIEFGHSKQAPQGVSRLAARRVRKHLRGAIAKVNRVRRGKAAAAAVAAAKRRGS